MILWRLKHASAWPQSWRDLQRLLRIVVTQNGLDLEFSRTSSSYLPSYVQQCKHALIFSFPKNYKKLVWVLWGSIYAFEFGFFAFKSSQALCL